MFAEVAPFLLGWIVDTGFLKQRRWSMACRRLVGRRWTSTSIRHSGLTLLTTTYTYAQHSSLLNAFVWEISCLQFTQILFSFNEQHPNSWHRCRSRTSGFTTLVPALSRTWRTASSSKSHGHVFPRIFSTSILAPHFLPSSVASKPTINLRKSAFTDQQNTLNSVRCEYVMVSNILHQVSHGVTQSGDDAVQASLGLGTSKGPAPDLLCFGLLAPCTQLAG
jgi:hypothetical protein